MVTGRCNPHQTIVIPGENLFRINLTYFVDATYGDDATGEQDNPARPFRTIGAPSAIAIPGSIVYVRPGTYAAGIIQLRQGVAWYFEKRAILTETQFQGNASSAIAGHATFINTLTPVLDYSGTGGIVFEVDEVNYSGPDYAFLIRGSGKTNLGVTRMNGSAIRGTNSQLNVIFHAITQVGGGIIQLDDTSSGHASINITNADNSGNSIIIRSNNMDVTFESQAAISRGDYFIDILDNPSSIQSDINLNLNTDRLECFGLVRSIGIPSVIDVLRQPNLNLHISTIVSDNNPIAQPIMDLSYTTCNIAYNRLSFSYLVPIDFIIICGETTVLTVNGAQTFISDQTLTSNVGFLQVNGGATSSIANMNLIEATLTSRVTEVNGSSVVYFNVTNLTNIVTTPGVINIANSGRIGLFIRNALIGATGVTTLFSNNGEMFIESDNIEVQANGCAFIDNALRLQTKIGRLISSGNNNIFVRARGLTGLTIGTITMVGTGNLGLSIENNRTTINIGQIDGSAQPGNIGISAINDSQILGGVIAIRMNDNYCLDFETNGLTSDLKVGTITVVNAAASAIHIGDNTNLILNCDNFVCANCSVPIFIENVGYNQLNFDKISIATCDSGIRITGGPNCNNVISVNDFTITNDATVAGISLESGTLTAKGNYTMRTTSRSGVFLVNNNSKLQANLGFVTASFYNLVTDSFEEIWYSSQDSRVIDPTGSNVLVNLVAAPPSSALTLDGPFFTNQSSNFIFTGGNNPGAVRILNPYLVAPGAPNINASANPLLIMFSNYGVCNNGFANATEVPAGSITVAAIA